MGEACGESGCVCRATLSRTGLLKQEEQVQQWGEQVAVFREESSHEVSLAVVWAGPDVVEAGGLRYKGWDERSFAHCDGTV